MSEWKVEINHCDCHPETCCCRKWKLIDKQGSSFETFNSRKKALMVAGLLNRQQNTHSATGYVTYNVRTTCPHCNKDLHLNQYPYNDDSTEFSLEEDELGAALFGFKDKPAQWQNLDIEYECCGCRNKFTLTTLAT